MVGKHDPGQVYFIHTIDQGSGKSHGYYKIGIVRNDRESSERIKEHQTGNPHRIVPYKILLTKAPMLIEALLHAEFSENQVSTEWFKFDEHEIAAVVTRAEELDKKYGEAVSKMSQYYGVTATKPELVLTGDDLSKAKELQQRAYELESEVKKHYFIMKKAEHELEALTDCHEYGILGVSYIETKDEKEGFNLAKWWSKATDAQKEKAGKLPNPENDFTMLYNIDSTYKKVTAGHWKEMYPKEEKAMQDAKKKVPKHRREDITKTSLPRTSDIEALHKVYCDEKGKHDGKKKRLEGVTIQLMIMCGEHSGIKDICTWNRTQKTEKTSNLSLTKKHFSADLEDRSYWKKTDASATLNVYPFRPYV